jgi:hypothetical protein
VSQALFALERRFELHVLYVFQAMLLAVAVYAIVIRDWWLVGTCVVAFFLNGLIGQGLQKNRRKSFAQLSGGSAGEPQTPADLPGDAELFLLMRTVIKFRRLAVLTAAVVTYQMGQRWWVIVGAAVAAWAVSMLLMATVLAKGRPR